MCKTSSEPFFVVVLSLKVGYVISGKVNPWKILQIPKRSVDRGCRTFTFLLDSNLQLNDVTAPYLYSSIHPGASYDFGREGVQSWSADGMA